MSKQEHYTKAELVAYITKLGKLAKANKQLKQAVQDLVANEAEQQYKKENNL
jgi:hypothetical protein